MFKFTRRAAIGSAVALSIASSAMAADMTFTLATSGTENDARSVAMREVFAPMVSGFADFNAGYNGRCLPKVQS